MYIPELEFDEKVSEANKSKARLHLFHHIMDKVLGKPLRKLNTRGRWFFCASDDKWRLMYPRVSYYITDWPEGRKVTCTRCVYQCCM